jgi:hypothetical protein
MAGTLVGRALSVLNPTIFARPAGAGDPARRRGDDGLVDSPEGRPHAELIRRLYRTFFGREPEPESLTTWIGPLLDGRSSPIQVAQDFVAADEFRAIHGDDPTPDAFAVAACRNALGREPDPAECRPWGDFLAEHGNGKPARAAAGLEIARAMAARAASGSGHKDGDPPAGRGGPGRPRSRRRDPAQTAPAAGPHARGPAARPQTRRPAAR